MRTWPFFVATLLLNQLCVAAENAPLRLTCEYTHSISADGTSAKEQKTTGSFLVTITETGGGKVSIKLQDLGTRLTGNITAEEITGEATYGLGSDTYKVSIRINRFSGTFEKHDLQKDGKLGIIFYGNCRAATAPLF